MADSVRFESNYYVITALVVAVVVVGTMGTATAQAIEVEGDFRGELVGYGDGDRPHQISTTGQLTFRGENAQDVDIIIEPGPRTVLDRSSITTFVEGDQNLSFDRSSSRNRVVFETEEVPSGTTIQIEYRTVYVGGTESNNISAGTVTTEFETAGGTAGDASFESPTNMTASADNRIAALQSNVSRLETFRLVGIAGVAIAVLAIVVAVVLRRRYKNKIEELEEKLGRGGGTPPSPP